MNKWRYALFGWVAWKVTKRYARRKLPVGSAGSVGPAVHRHARVKRLTGRPPNQRFARPLEPAPMDEGPPSCLTESRAKVSGGSVRRWPAAGVGRTVAFAMAFVSRSAIDPARVRWSAEALSSGTVGEFYCCGNLFASGGVQPYTWTVVAGALPPGLELPKGE